MRLKFKSCLTILALLIPGFVFAQQKPAAGTSATGEKTVEEAYLQESLEGMIIREQAYAESKDMKLVALEFMRQAVKDGRGNEEIQRTLEYLSSEGTLIITRSAGVGVAINNFPDVRREACLLLGQFKTKAAKDTLVKVALAENEPMVIAAALRSLGSIGMVENDDVTQLIAFVVNRWDILMPDNMLAFESLVALEMLADATGGIKDPAAIRAIIRISDGNYITPVKQKAKDLVAKLRKMTAASGSGGK